MEARQGATNENFWGRRPLISTEHRGHFKIVTCSKHTWLESWNKNVELEMSITVFIQRHGVKSAWSKGYVALITKFYLNYLCSFIRSMKALFKNIFKINRHQIICILIWILTMKSCRKSIQLCKLCSQGHTHPGEEWWVEMRIAFFFCAKGKRKKCFWGWQPDF